MAKKSTTAATTTQEAAPRTPMPKCLEGPDGGIRTGQDVIALMSAVSSNLYMGTMTAPIGNAICNCVGKINKTVELCHKYGTAGITGARNLALTDRA